MKQLSQILEVITAVDKKNITEILIENIAADSRLIKKNGMFFSVSGANLNGRDFEKKAIENGARVIVSENEPKEYFAGVAYIKVKNIRKQIAIVSDFFFDSPSKKISIVGVTGTNGKSSVVNFLFQIFNSLGHKSGLISTINYIIGNKKFDSTHTTPDSITLNYMLKEMVKENCKFCFMEVSSHSLSQFRVYAIKYKVGVFTNISHDHLDYHKTFENYLRTKKSFFDSLAVDSKLIYNSDDKNSLKIVEDSNAEIKTYSIRNKTDYSCKVIESTIDGLHLKINNKEIYTRVCGEFNAYNLLAAYATCIELNLQQEMVLIAISNIVAAEGRFEIIKNKNFVSILDYAHTDDAFRNIYSSIKKITKKSITTVFGCGGDRDKHKRSVMLDVVSKNSDFVIITSDNPRNETFDEITKDMLSNSSNDEIKRYFIVEDREQAIKLGCTLSIQKKSLLLVAGKGHEKFQEKNGIKTPFDDKKIIIKYS